MRIPFAPVYFYWLLAAIPAGAGMPFFLLVYGKPPSVLGSIVNVIHLCLYLAFIWIGGRRTVNVFTGSITYMTYLPFFNKFGTERIMQLPIRLLVSVLLVNGCWTTSNILLGGKHAYLCMIFGVTGFLFHIIQDYITECYRAKVFFRTTYGGATQPPPEPPKPKKQKKEPPVYIRHGLEL